MNPEKRVIGFLLLAILMIPSTSIAGTIAVKATGEYIMGDNDTFTEGKKLALQDAKRLILEKVGTYIESTTEVKDGAVSSDEIKQYTAWIIKVDVVDEQRHILDSKATIVKVTVSATVDPDGVVHQVMALQKRKEVEEKAKKLSSENERLRKEINILSQQLRSVADEARDRELRARRNATIQKLLDNEKGLTMLISGEALVEASLVDLQKKKDDRQLVRRFLEEIARAYEIISEEPEVEDNGDGTSNVTIRYWISLPGRYDLNESRINVPCIDEFLSKGFVIKTFSHGGMIVRCGNVRDRKCNKILAPYFDHEVRKMHISVTLGDRTVTEAVGLLESSQRQKVRIREIPPPKSVRTPDADLPPIPPGLDYLIPGAQALRTSTPPGGHYREQEIPREPEPRYETFKVGALYYPLVNSGAYACLFKRIPHETLKKMSKIEIKICYE